MISQDLKQVILDTLRLDEWELSESTLASEVPGWDSLNHMNVVLAAERYFQVKFRPPEVLRLKNVGDLQRLIDEKVSKRTA